MRTAPLRGSRRGLCRSSSAMPLYFSPLYTIPLPDKHSFPMERYEGVRRAVTEAGLEFLDPTPRPHEVEQIVEQITGVHCAKFVHKFMSGNLARDQIRKIGFPWSQQLVQRTLAITNATMKCTNDVLNSSDVWIACNMAGGTHHAFRAHGEGYCIFNDIGVAAAMALEHKEVVQNILVIDLDVHQGNGTAEIFEHNPAVFTFSQHADSNYPWSSRKPSDLDVALPNDVSDEQYNNELRDSLRLIAQFLGHDSAGKLRCDLVFFQAGVDPLTEDRLGNLSLSREGLFQRNQIVYDFCADQRIPAVVCMGGGYSRPIEASVQAHCDVFLQASAHSTRMLNTKI